MGHLRDVYHAASIAAQAADDAWCGALHRVYGKTAGGALYDRRGYATPELCALKARKLASDDVRQKALLAMMATDGGLPAAARNTDRDGVETPP